MLSKDAFDLAEQALVPLRLADRPASALIIPESKAFRVEFSLLYMVDVQLWSASAVVRVDSETRTATLKTQDLRRFDGARPSTSNDSRLLSTKQAYEYSLRALERFSDYDAQGRTEITFRDAKYIVTFPLPNVSTAPVRGPDFAMQITLDAHTGVVLEKRVAS